MTIEKDIYKKKYLKRVEDCKQIKKDHCSFIKCQDTKHPGDSKQRNKYHRTLYSKSKQTTITENFI